MQKCDQQVFPDLIVDEEVGMQKLFEGVKIPYCTLLMFALIHSVWFSFLFPNQIVEFNN